MGKWTALAFITEWAILKVLITLAIPMKFIIYAKEIPEITDFAIGILVIIKLKEVVGKMDKPITETTERLKNNESIKSIIDEHIPKEGKEK